MSEPPQVPQDARPPSRPPSYSFGDYLRFRAMVTPILIQIGFWIGLVVCVVGGGTLLGEGDERGLLIMLLGPLALRVYCELIIVTFKILQAVREIARNTSS